jgi:hypothetical protein
MIVIQGVIKKAIFTIFSSNDEFIYNKKDHSISFMDDKKESIKIADLFKEYKNIDKIILKIYEGGTEVSSSTFFRKKQED